MVNSYQECEEYARNILQRIPVLRTRQIVKALYKLCPYITSEEEALLTMRKIQRKGYLFMSPDGYTVNRGAYSIATDDRFLNDIDNKYGDYAVGNLGQALQKKRLLTSATDCFWIACDFLPYSYEFIANLTPPWSICFDVKTSDETSKVYQVMKIRGGDAYQAAEIIKSLPRVPEEVRSNIIRIAVLEDPREKDIVPHQGFKFICTIDESKARGYTLIEKREDDEIWM